MRLNLARNLPLFGVACLSAFLVLAGCNGSSSGGSPYTLELQAPAADADVQTGDAVQVSYVDEDPNDTATTDLYADRDGDVATTGDRYTIATGRPDGDGTVQTLPWDTTGVAPGTYFIVGTMTDGTNGTVTDTCPGRVTVHTVWPMDHTNIVLRDQLGNALQPGSTLPYSPRQTCGTCHDVDEIANGYHFQQGRTDETGAFVMQDDYFNDGRDWLKSAGMYGKW